MKHDPHIRDVVSAALRAAGVELPDSNVDALALHLTQVIEANAVQNLTAIRDVGEAARLHVVDSLTALPELIAAPAGRVVDLGSGAGYPGVPLAIVTRRQTTLLESVGNKAEFLQRTAVLLAPHCDLSVRNIRAELLAVESPGAFSAVTARAVSALPSLVELASPLLSTGGVLIALKGPLEDDEFDRGVRVAGLVAMENAGVRETTLPGGEKRTLVVFRRTGEVPETHVPRRSGRAQRKPLA